MRQLLPTRCDAGRKSTPIAAPTPFSQTAKPTKSFAPIAISIVVPIDGLDLAKYGHDIVKAMGPKGKVLIGGEGTAGFAGHSTPRLRIGSAIEGLDLEVGSSVRSQGVR